MKNLFKLNLLAVLLLSFPTFAVDGMAVIVYSVGFIAGAETQTEGAMDGLRFFYSAIPILGTLGAIYVMKDYDIDEQRAEEIKAELMQRNGQ